MSPWSDCKVAFYIKDDYLIARYWHSGHFDSRNKKMPYGWRMVEIDSTRSQSVAIFQVEGPLSEQDGQIVRELLDKIEKEHKA